MNEKKNLIYDKIGHLLATLIAAFVLWFLSFVMKVYSMDSRQIQLIDLILKVDSKVSKILCMNGEESECHELEKVPHGG